MHVIHIIANVLVLADCNKGKLEDYSLVLTIGVVNIAMYRTCELQSISKKDASSQFVEVPPSVDCSFTADICKIFCYFALKMLRQF